MSSTKNIEKNREFWDDLADCDPSCSTLDPHDTLGFKNRYIRQLTAKMFRSLLSDLPDSSFVLDFGCGAGHNLVFLTEMGYKPIGVDISFHLLSQVESVNRRNGINCMQYDGNKIPILSNTMHAAITYVVLNYLVDNEDFLNSLREIHRVLRKGAKFILIEQVTGRKRLSKDGVKLQRTKKEFLQLFSEAGFTCLDNTMLRRGHFPLIYFIRYGLVSCRFFSLIARVEKIFGKVFPWQIADYSEVLFVLTKNSK